MGNCCCVQVDLDETQDIQFYGQPSDRLIKNTYPTYNATLVQRTGKNGQPRVFQATHVPPGNRATVLVYIYTSTPPANGTYVVLQFEESGLYFACNGNGKNAQLVLQSGTDAKEITSTADPRVFLMKLFHNSPRDLVYASCVASQQSPKDPSKARVITLLKNSNTPAVFRLEGKGPTLESQYFTMESATQGSAGEQSDECQVQEEHM